MQKRIKIDVTQEHIRVQRFIRKYDIYGAKSVKPFSFFLAEKQ